MTPPPRGMVGRIYVQYYVTLLHAKYTSSSFCGFREEDFYCYKSMADIDAPGVWLAGYIKGTTKHCYIQNIESLGLVLWRRSFFIFFPM